MNRKRVAILISGRGSNMEALIGAAAGEAYPAEIALVISDNAAAAGLKRAAALGVPTAIVEHRRYGSDRERFERALAAELAPRGIELICLAGFMRVLSPHFVGNWPERLLNVHPALLPAFKGLNTHQRALAAGVKIHGATIHFVSPEIDSGPIIAQAALGVRPEDTAETLAARVLVLEHRIYAAALQLVAAGRVRVRDATCVLYAAGVGDEVLVVPKT